MRETRYFTGVPCKHGHVCERLISSRTCVECTHAHRMRTKKKDPEATRRWNRISYERTKDTRRKVKFDILRPRPAVCECCGEPPTIRGLHLDHDHVTGLFRGWVCHHCNLAIGHLGDTLGGVLKAVDYLKRAARDRG